MTNDLELSTVGQAAPPRRRWRDQDPLLVTVLLWIAFLPIQFRTEALGGDRFAPSDIIILAVPFIAAGRLRIVRATWSIWHTLLIALMPFGLIVAGTLEGSVTRWAIVNKTLGLYLLFLAYVAVIVTIKSWSAVLRVARLLLLSITVVNLFSIGAYLVGWQTDLVNDPDLDRLTGMLIDPNAYGGLLVVGLALLIPGALRGERLLPRPFHYAAWISLPYGVLLTQSRSAWVALAAMFLALGLASPRKATRALVAILLVTAVIAIAAGAENRASFIERSDRPQTIDSRVSEARDGLNAYVESPVVGIGLGVYYERYDQIVHFTALWVLADMGVVGFVILVGFFGVITLWAIRLMRGSPREGTKRDLALGLLMAHASVIGLSVGIEALYQRHWWLVMALIASMYAQGAAAPGPVADGRVAEVAATPAVRSRFYRASEDPNRNR